MEEIRRRHQWFWKKQNFDSEADDESVIFYLMNHDPEAKKLIGTRYRNKMMAWYHAYREIHADI